MGSPYPAAIGGPNSGGAICAYDTAAPPLDLTITFGQVSQGVSASDLKANMDQAAQLSNGGTVRPTSGLGDGGFEFTNVTGGKGSTEIMFLIGSTVVSVTATDTSLGSAEKLAHYLVARK